MSGHLFAGLDIGGTKALGVVVTLYNNYEVIATARDSSHGDGTALINTLAKLCEELASTASSAATPTTDTNPPTTDTATPIRFEAVGIAMAGLANRSGVVHYSPNLPEIVELPLAQGLSDELATRLGYRPRVSLDNDATSGTWAEAHLGAGRGCDDFIFVALGTGIGTGYVVGGQLLQGANGFAGEAGQMIVDINGPTHITGVRGPWEYFGSGNALERMGREAAATGGFDMAADLANSVEALTGRQIHEAIGAGDTQALRILDEYSAHVALGIANLVMILDPARVIIGGGVADIGEPLRSGIERELQTTILGVSHRPTPEVVLAQLGAEANAIGAALMANDLLDGTPENTA